MCILVCVYEKLDMEINIEGNIQVVDIDYWWCAGEERCVVVGKKKWVEYII